MFTVAQKAECVLWYQEYGSPKKVQIQFRKKYGRNEKSPDGKEIKAWSKKFKETGSCLRQPAKRTPTVDRDAIVEDYIFFSGHCWDNNWLFPIFRLFLINFIKDFSSDGYSNRLFLFLNRVSMLRSGENDKKNILY